jgi:RepB DNA-primase from phage plasmid
VTNLDEAFRMVDIFASCGATTFFVTKTGLEWPDHKEVKWGKSYSLESLREKLPGIVKTAAIRHPVELPDGQGMMAGENVIIRPTGPDVAFVQLDDLKTPELERVRPAAFIIHATSPGNYQAWVALSGVPQDKDSFKAFTRRVRKAVGGNDKAASHATRLAGTENFKAKYGPDFPTVNIIEAHPGHVVSMEQLEAMGLLAAPAPESATGATPSKARKTGPSDYRTQTAKAWPNYAISLAGAPQNDSGNGPDRSMADFTWCMTAIDWGWPIEETAAKLPEVSEKARERVQLGDEGYPLITAQNAAAAVERNKLKRGRG